MVPRRILVTSALPYANGDIHLGHLVGYVQADVWCRYQRMVGSECHFVCADDAHGTAIMLRAKADGISPEALIDAVNETHQCDFKNFFIEFDHYHSTHSEENRQFSESIFKTLDSKGLIDRKNITQAYDEKEGLFLSDRYIKGNCPRCNEPDQYGDNCEKCSAVYAPTDLINPYSVLSGNAPVERESEHYFFKLSEFTEILKAWVHSGVLHEGVANKLDEWLDSGLKDWDISRDAPYFGFIIPGTTDKYFYVWLDAPIGYMASFEHYCQQRGINFDDFWKAGEDTQLYHFIGKDIVNFHALFWPSLLENSGYRKPTAISVNGFLTINGSKMSKSRGTFINASEFINAKIPPETLRYYFCTKLSAGVEDIDLNFEDFVQRVNSDLVGKVVNIASRTSGFIHKLNSGMLGPCLDNKALLDDLVNQTDSIFEFYENREYAKAMRAIMLLADKTNEYITEQAPWQLAERQQEEKAIAVCTTALNCFKYIIHLLQPVLPAMADNVAEFLQCELNCQPNAYLIDHAILKFKPLLQRLELKQVEQLLISK